MDQTILKRISTWGKFFGIIMMIIGILSALSGLFAFVVGAIPGVLMTIMAFYIFKSAKSAEAYIDTEEGEALYRLLDYYGRFLLLGGIMMIIYIILFILSIIVFLIFGLTFVNEFDNIYFIHFIY